MTYENRWELIKAIRAGGEVSHEGLAAMIRHYWTARCTPRSCGLSLEKFGSLYGFQRRVKLSELIDAIAAARLTVNLADFAELTRAPIAGPFDWHYSIVPETIRFKGESGENIRIKWR